MVAEPRIYQAVAAEVVQVGPVPQVTVPVQVMAATLQFKVWRRGIPQEGAEPLVEVITRLVIVQNLAAAEEQALATEPMPEMEAVRYTARAVVEVQSVSPLEKLVGQAGLGVTIVRAVEQQVVPMATLVPLVIMELAVTTGAETAAEEQDAVPHQAMPGATAVTAVRLEVAAVVQGLVRAQAQMGKAVTERQGLFGFFHGR